MLSLTKQQQKKIRFFNQTSFSAYCDICGYDPVEHANQLLHMVKAQLDHIVGQIDLNNIPNDEDGSKFKSDLAKMRDATDYFEFRKVEHERRRISLCATISRFAPHLPINYTYAARLCRDLKILEPSQTNPESITSLIESVPVVSNWGFEFNAFITGKSLIDSIPCVFIYEALMSTCDTFLNCIVPSAIQFKDKARPTPIKEAEIKGSQPDFMEELHGCINMAIGNTNFVKTEAVKTDLKTRQTISVMIEASIMAVWCHEFGHLLHGHLVQQQSHQLEFEADSFAFQVIAREANPPLDIWMALGGITPLVVIDLLQTILNLPESQSHPASKQRIKNGLEIYKVHVPNVVKPTVQFLDSLAAVCNPTLDKFWGVSLDYGEVFCT